MFQCYDRGPSQRGVPTLHTDASGTAPPDEFGPFRVLHQIGAGVLGPVFRAYQPDPGRLVAVKQFRLDLPPESSLRFVAALDRLIAADLTHLGIAAPLAAGITDNSPFLALDFVAAESFDVVMREYGPAPVADALRIVTQLGGALDFAAAVNVFHGALHPRDVLVSTDDARVTGLGVAQALEEVGVAAPIRRPYAAPERVAGATWDRRADIFSLAALVFEMLFGRRIVGAGTEAADAMTPIEGVDMDALRAVFAKALAENPADRFDTALGFADALHGVLGQPAPVGKPVRNRRRSEPDAARPRTPERRVSRPALPLEPDVDLPLTRPAAEPLPLGLADEPLALGLGDEPVIEARSDAPQATTPAPELAAPGSLDGNADASAAPRLSDGAARSPRTPVRPDEGRADSIARREQAARGAQPARDAQAAPDVASQFGDLELRAAEDDRYTLAESTSALPDSAAAAVPPPVAPEAVQSSIRREPVVNRVEVEPPAPRAETGAASIAERHTTIEPPRTEPIPAPLPPAPEPVRREPELFHGSLSSAALEQGRSAIWPLALALVVGLMVGFAFGYGAGTRERSVAQNGGAATSTGDVGSAPEAASPTVTPPASASQPPASTGPGVAASGGSAAGTGAIAPDAAASTPPPSGSATRPAPPAPRPTPTPEKPAADSGRVLVRSTPAGARVALDGRDVGVTPLTLNNLAFGAHVIRISHQGYLAAERRVRIRSTQPAQSIEVELAEARAARPAAPMPAAPERTSGSLMVDSRPTGARVFVDGRLVGTTPLLLDDVSAGDHGVRLELDGFDPWSTTARVSGGERARVSGSLEQR